MSESRPDFPTPDWSQDSASYLGGYLTEIRNPMIRRWPGPGLRVVRVSPVRIFKHWHTSMREKDNPLWNRDKGVWQMAWGDEEGRGRHEFAIFNTKREVSKWVAEMTNRYFPPSTHIIVDDWAYMAVDEPEPAYIIEARRAAQRAAKREGD